MEKQMYKGNISRDYEGKAGRQRALVDLCHSRKAEYALPIAKKIVAHTDKNKRIPVKIASLFSSLATQIGSDTVAAKELIE
jgi:hypothetical protein